MHLSEVEVPTNKDRSCDKNSAEFGVFVSSFEEFQKSLFDYWQRNQNTSTILKKQEQPKVFVQTERDPKDQDRLYTSMYFFNPRGTLISYEEEYSVKAKTRPNYAQRCMLSGLIYASELQAITDENFNPEITYIDDSGVLYKGERIQEAMKEFRRNKPLSGTVRKIPEKVITYYSSHRE